VCFADLATTCGVRTVTYKISGSASSALITYSTPSGQEQRNGTHVP
jgi:hypothetical protein